MIAQQLTAQSYWGKLPTGWNLLPIKQGFRLIGSGTTPPTGEKDFYDGSIPWVTTSELRENRITSTNQTLSKLAIEKLSALKIFPKNTVLIAMYGATVGRVAILDIPACVNQAVCALAEPTHLVPEFVSYALQVSKFFLLSLVSGGGQPNLNAEKITSHLIPCPPISEQYQIVSYLDRETQKIDALIAAKKRLLELLAEKRRSLITHAVTRGLNAGASIKHSKMEWFGEIPIHWSLVKIKHVAIVGNGSTPLRDEASYWQGGLFPWLTSTVVNDDVIGEAEEFVTEIALKECHLPIVQPGSVLVAITGQGKTRGKAAILPYQATINQHLAFITPSKKLLDSNFLQLLLTSAYGVLRTISEGMGSTKGALTCEQVGDFFIPLPPITEQREIVAKLQNQIQKIDLLSSVANDTIALLQERRTSLISAAVTGQLEIPD
jgi:type I restriction enzyme S subunit